MMQTQRELGNHLEFQLSLLRLSNIPGPAAATKMPTNEREARQLQELVESFAHSVRRSS